MTQLFLGVLPRRVVLNVWIVCIALLLGSCRQSVDLSSVVALSQSTSDSQETFASLSDDFYQSCIRTVGWQRAAEPGSSPNVFTTCAEEAKAATMWQTANSVVTAYVASLGDLAGASSKPGDYGLSNLAQTIGNIGSTKSFTQPQQLAIVGAVTSLVNDYFDIKRREALSNIIPKADSDLAALIGVLENVAKTNYITQLETERIAVALFFQPNISRAKPGVQTLYAFNFRATERDQEAAVDTHQAAVANYVAALEQIKTTHHNIASAISSDRISDVAGIVSAYVAAYKPQIAAIQKAFK